MKLSDKGLDFIIGFEGKLKPRADGSYEAYQCQAGVWTIYAGCTEGVREGDVVSEDEGKVLFRRELKKHEHAVHAAVTVDISQDQYDALVSFSYNCGIGAMKRVAGVLNAEGPKAAAAKLLEYCRYTDPADGQKKVSRGLVRRRAAEARLLEPNDGPVHMPQKVEPPPKTMDVKGALVKVGAPVVAGLEVARQAVPSVPTGITETVTNVGAWKDTGGQVVSLGREAWSVAAAMPWLAAAVVVLIAALLFFKRGPNAEAS